MVKRSSEPSSNADVVINLDKKKQVTVRKFNNINLVDIREFYIDKESGEKRPGKKGISLTEDVWKKLLESASEIQAALDGLDGSEEKRRKVEKVDEVVEKKVKNDLEED
jgi:hypothetical protein